MYALGVPEGYRPYDVFYATENRYNLCLLHLFSGTIILPQLQVVPHSNGFGNSNKRFNH